MKKIITVFGVFVLAITLMSSAYIKSVDKKENSKEDEIQNVDINILDECEVVFSKEAGFYSEPFLLSLNGNEACNTDRGAIYYTLDGSVPDLNDNRYDGEIYIKDISAKDNIWADLPDISTVYYKDKIADEYGRPISNYKGLGFKIDKCTVVKAAYIDKNGNSGPVKTASYFVGLKDDGNYKDIMVASLSFDSDLFFGYENGIYVTGIDFENTFRKHDNGKTLGDKYAYWASNYTRRGEESERDVVIELFDKKGKLLEEKNAGARIQGNVSRGHRQKSISLRSYGDGFSENIFRNGQKYPIIELYACSMEKTKFRNYVGHELAKNCRFSTIESIPCVLFLEGEYWGMYDLGWRYSPESIAVAYDIPKDEVIFMKNGEIKSEGEEDECYWKQLIAFVTKRNMRSYKNYEKVCDMIDMESYIDYYATMLYWGRNGDWPGTNIAMFRSRNNLGKGYQDGRWRLMLFDLDKLCYEKELTDYDNFYAAIYGGGDMENMFKSLLKNDEFRSKLRERIIELSDGYYSVDRFDDVAKDYFDKYGKEVLHNSERWTNKDYSENMWWEEVEGMRYFFANRKKYVVELLNQYVPDGE